MIPNRLRLRCAARFLPLALAALAACSDAVAPVARDGPLDLTLEWETARPGAAGMDEDALRVAEALADDIPSMRSLLVVRRGRLVLERYWDGGSASDMADVRSVTKTVVSTLTGLAVERGMLTLDRTLGDLLPETVATLDEWERGIRVRDLLTMSGGWEWREEGAIGYAEWLVAGDHVAYLLDKPQVSAPGSEFEYNSAAVHLLGVVLEEAIGGSLPAFADEVLFGPLGISARAWEPLEDGRVNGGAGIDLRPRDLARFGQLFLQDGVSGDRRILPSGWVEEATVRRWPWQSDAGPTRVSYGYLWWTDEVNDAWLAWGYGGQFVYVAPARDLVVVTTTEWRGGTPADLSSQVLRVIVDGVLPAAPPDPA
jgi:CubicO group peptidase (beta-lactamase class C family)